MFGSFKKQSRPKQAETLLDSLNATVLECLCIMADDGKDKLVNHHLQERADKFSRKVHQLKRRAERIARGDAG